MSLIQSANQAQDTLRQGFEHILKTHLIALGAIHHANHSLMTATHMLVQHAVAPKTIVHDEQGKPIGVMPIK